MRWRWWIHDTDDEAAEHLARLADQDPHVEQLGRELREYQRRNNFSGMVDRAIHRATQGGG